MSEVTDVQARSPLHNELENSFTQSLVNCLEPLLSALKWPGQTEHIFSALPYMSGISSVHDFIATMENLNYTHHSFKTDIQNISTHFMPCLFVSEDKQVFVILRETDDGFLVFNGKSESEMIVNYNEKKPDNKKNTINGTAHVFAASKSLLTDFAFFSKIPFLKTMIKPYHSALLQGVLVAFVLSIFALVVPLFSRMVFDQVIPSKSETILINFLFAIIAVIIVSGILNYFMSKLLIFSGVKLSDHVNNAVLKRLIFLAPSFTESTTVNAQVARVKDFDHVREFVIGPIFRLFFEIVFIVLGLLVIGYLGGFLVLIPIISIGLYLLFFVIMKSFVSHAISLSAKLSTDRQNFMLESFTNLRALKYLHAEETWIKRYKIMSAEATIQNFNSSELNSTINGILDLIMASTGFAIVGFGALSVMDGTLTFGSLIAIMIIAARLVAPLKGLFGSQARIQQFIASVKQVNSLMTIVPERDPHSLLHKLEDLKGDIMFSNVSFRYPNAPDFAIMGVNFSIKHGEVAAVVGPIGSGKSTLLKLLLGLYANQAGHILINGIDIRQYDVMNLRYSMGYVSQANYIFYGTVAQNLFLAKPTATEEELRYATQRADILDEILAMPQGFETAINDQSIMQLSPGFQQRLALARTYLKKPSIILLDEPVTALDEHGSAAFVDAIKYFKGHATIFIVTHRPSHLQLADQILVLNHGQMILSGTSGQVMSALKKESI